jgi:hypothetical protein
MTPTERESNGWSKYEQYVLAALDRLEDGLKGLHTSLTNHCSEEEDDRMQLRTALTELKTRVAIWGAVILAVATMLGPVLTDVFQHVFASK